MYISTYVLYVYVYYSVKIIIFLKKVGIELRDGEKIQFDIFLRTFF